MYYSPVTGRHNASFMKHSALHMKYTKTYVTEVVKRTLLPCWCSFICRVHLAPATTSLSQKTISENERLRKNKKKQTHQVSVWTESDQSYRETAFSRAGEEGGYIIQKPVYKLLHNISLYSNRMS